MNRVHDLVGFASDAALAIDDCSQIAAWNQGAEQLFGYSLQEVIGRNCGEILQAVLPSGELLCVHDCEIFRCFQCNLPCGVEDCHIRRKNGDRVAVNISSIVTSKLNLPSRTASVIAVVFLHEKKAGHVQTLPHKILHVSTLGCFNLTVGGHSVALEKWKRKQTVTLLKYLINQVGRPVHRKRLINYLWPNVDQNRGWDRLKVTIYQLRRELRTIGVGDDILKTVGNAYLLQHDAVRVDTESFENLLAEGWALQLQQSWEAALRCYNEAEHLYQGDYLEEDVYVDWCAEERERLRELYLEMLTDMAQCYAQRGHYTEAVRVCRTALAREPCRESIHRTLMEYLARLGQPDRAVAQFHACQRILAQELDVDPIPETQTLYQQILKGAIKKTEPRT